LFSVALPLPVTVDPAMKEDFRDENKSGDDFIDRVYRPSYIEKMITEVSEIVEKTDVPYRHTVSSLYSCKPRGSALPVAPS
jgi:hypothetical protein